MYSFSGIHENWLKRVKIRGQRALRENKRQSFGAYEHAYNSPAEYNTVGIAKTKFLG